MLALLRSTRSPRVLLQTSRVGAYARHYASEVSDSTPRDTATSTPAAPSVPELQPEPEELENPDDKPLRPPHGVTIDPDHGLNAFFRAFQQPDGRWERLSAQPKSEDGNTGRSWSAPELRRKSFKDLHTLWYVLLRERNLLATQKEELRRLGVLSIGERTDLPWRVHQCRKSMARIKYIINERRLAYEGAVELFAQDKELAKIGALAPPAKKVAPKTNGRMTASRRAVARTPAAPAALPTPASPTESISA